MADTTGTVVLEPMLRHRLQLAAEYAHATTHSIAAELGVSENTVRNYMAGRTRPNRATLLLWAHLCGVDFAWLAGATSDDASTRWYVNTDGRPFARGAPPQARLAA